ncbi:MAG TPA: nucleotidyltransferase domain-containing protein [Aquifex aeolicus]|nr:nucleotidyltransferase domain-containing protein [Aquifex aeolicus]
MLKVRLSEEEIKAIAETAKEVFGENVKVWLFGSRVDLDKRGGDIDLYVETEMEEDILRKKLKFLVKLEEKIGEQKIDVIIKPFDSKDEISLIAKRTGVRLV